MPTTGVVNTKLLKVRVGSTPTAILRQNDAQLSINSETVDISTKDTDGWRETMNGLKSWSISGSGFWAFNDAAGGNQSVLYNALFAQTALPVEFGTGISGDPKFSGSAVVTQWEASSSGASEATSYSYTFEGNGALTIGTYP